MSLNSTPYPNPHGSEVEERPTIRDARQLLAFLAEQPLQAKQAFIVCRCRHPLQLHEKIMALPCFYL